MFTYVEMKIQGSSLLKIPGLFMAQDKNYKVLIFNLYFFLFITHSISFLFSPSAASHEDCCGWNQICFKSLLRTCSARPHDESAFAAESHWGCVEDVTGTG